MEKAELLLERPRDLPNPAIETCQLLADGTEIKPFGRILLMQMSRNW
jgi:hypothetical protein